MIAKVKSSHSERNSFSRHVQDDAKVSEASTFIDKLWDFEKEARAPNARNKINWEKILFQNGTALTEECNRKFYTTLKEYAYARIFNGGPAVGLKSVKIQTAIDDTLCLIMFARWLVVEGKNDFTEATQCDVDRYVDWVKSSTKLNGTGNRSDSYVIRVIIPIPQMWLYQDHIDYGINFSPWNGRAVSRVLNYKNTGTNKTEIIPDEVMRPLYVYANRIIQPDVIEPLKSALRKTPSRFSDKNLSCKGKRGRWGEFTEFKNKLERHPLFVKPEEYTAPMYYSHWRTLENDVVIIYAALIVIISGLSGMRDSEVRSLKLNAYSVEKDSAGQPKTYKLTGRTFKNAHDNISDELGGEERTWVVIKEVHDAVKVLEDLALTDPAFDQVRLFSRFGTNSTVTRNLRRLLEIAISNDDSLNATETEGQWKIKSSQFRRSLARWIVWQPFGIVAGKNLFGHARIATTQGYAASDPGWNKLVSKEESALIDEVMVDLAYDLTEGAAAGIKTTEIFELLGTAGDRRYDDVLFYLKHNKKVFHVGPYSYCFYDPDRAACKPFSPSDKPSEPVTSSCSPDRCANSCISRRHLSAWQALESDLQTLLRTKGLSVQQKQALDRERIRIESIIYPLTNKTVESSEEIAQEDQK